MCVFSPYPSNISRGVSSKTQAGINSEGQSRFGPSSVAWLWGDDCRLPETVHIWPAKLTLQKTIQLFVNSEIKCDLWWCGILGLGHRLRTCFQRINVNIDLLYDLFGIVPLYKRFSLQAAFLAMYSIRFLDEVAHMVFRTRVLMLHMEIFYRG